ncbi:MAG: PAS domain-containing protein [Myxococcales bacterium]|nr:PAS domain-containing protein [Myxococcales bacterium]
MVNKPTTAATLRSDEQLPSVEREQILQWLAFLRVVVAFFILGTTYFLYRSQSLIVPYSLIGVNVLVTLLSAVMIERQANNRLFVYFQIYWDFAFVSGLVYFTGGFDSLFSFLYILTIIFAAILTSRLHTNLIVLGCTFVYSLILVLQYLRVVNPLNLDPLEVALPSASEVTVKCLLNALAFFSSGLLASYLAARSKEAARQIEQQRQAMDDLRKLNDSIVQSLPIGLITVDADGVITFANRNVNAMLGRENGTCRGLNLAELLPALSDLGSHEKNQEIERLSVHRQKQILALTFADLQDTMGRVTGRMITMQDVTALRELEQVAKYTDRQTAIAKLAAGIAHEIRNPLASMSGSIQLLQSELTLEPIHAHLMNIVLRETDRLNNLINDFLAYARPTQRKDAVTDLSAVIAEQLGVLVNDPAFHEGIILKKNLEKDLICRFDPAQVRQILWNLFLNALQAMEETGGTLTVSARRSERHSGFIEIEIQDTGKGIPSEYLGSIFDPFFTTKEKGTGLGLTIAYRIVENHDGKIFVDSTPDRGTSFHVLIPG